MSSTTRLTLEYDHADEMRFWSKVDVRGADDCWPWTGGLNNTGYGKFDVKGVTTSAHKFAFICTFGPLPEAQPVVDHTCHHHTGCERATCQHIICCNPRHLRASTQSANIRASDTHLGAINARKTHCPSGHSYAEHGFRNNRGQRQCRICVNTRRALAYVPKSNKRRPSKYLPVPQTQDGTTTAKGGTT